LKRICEERDLTEDMNQSSGFYVAKLKEDGFFEINNILAEELNHLLKYADPSVFS